MARPLVSETAESVHADLGPWAQGDNDSTGWALLHLLQSVTAALDEVEQLSRDSDAGPGWSGLTDVDRIPAEWLPWLAQFVGARPGVLAGKPEAAQRDELRDVAGFKRGTVRSLKRAVAYLMLPGNEAEIIERDGSPYRFTVNLYLSQMEYASYHNLKQEYPTYAGFSAAVTTYAGVSLFDRVRAALEAAKPAGLVMDVVIIDDQV